MQLNLTNQKKNFRAPFYKRFFYGFMSIAGAAVLLTLLYLVVTGVYFPDNVFSTITRTLLAIFFLVYTWTFFLTSLERVIIDGDKLTLQRGVFRKNNLSIDLATVGLVEASQTSFARASFKKPYNQLTLIGKDPNDKLVLDIIFLRKRDRREILRILEPIILRKDATHVSDRRNIQSVLSAWDNDSPIKLTEDAQELARRSKKNTKLLTILLVVVLAPIFLIFVLAPLGWLFNNYKCDNLLNNGQVTTAFISSVDTTTSSSTPNNIEEVNLHITYEVQGKSYNEIMHVSYSSFDANKALYDKVKNAKSVDIRYAQNNPYFTDLADNFKDGTASLCKQL